MANLTETSTFDAGVYQLETTDPVQGGASGVSNAPQKNLTNRTRWLKDAVDALVTAVGLRALINSPAFTGTPTAPTPALSLRNTQVATAGFAHAIADGVLLKNVAGGATVTLTDDEAAWGILAFAGTLTANINVLVPALHKSWIVQNGTTGPFTLTVKTAGAYGVTVAQGKRRELWCDGAGVNQSTDDFAGNGLQYDLGFTPVRQGGGPSQGANQINAGWDSSRVRLAVDGADIGQIALVSDIAAEASTRSSNDTTLQGNINAEAATRSASDAALWAGKQNNLGFTPVQQGTGAYQLGNAVKLGWDGATLRATVDSSDLGQLWSASNNPASLGAWGWQRLASGLIIQWGQYTVTTNTFDGVFYEGSIPVTFPISFPNGAWSVMVTAQNQASPEQNEGAWVSSVSPSGFAGLLRGAVSGWTYSGYYLAIGS